mgnify:CR=1 FL=1
MAYTKTTDFLAKDSLPLNNAGKYVKGSEIDTEFNNIATAVATKFDTSSTIAVANGGTGAATLTANNVLLGNGTSALQVVAPSTAGNVLTSNGTTWQSTTPAASGITAGKSIAFAMIFGF